MYTLQLTYFNPINPRMTVRFTFETYDMFCKCYWGAVSNNAVMLIESI